MVNSKGKISQVKKNAVVDFIAITLHRLTYHCSITACIRAVLTVPTRFDSLMYQTGLWSRQGVQKKKGKKLGY